MVSSIPQTNPKQGTGVLQKTFIGSFQKVARGSLSSRGAVAAAGHDVQADTQHCCLQPQPGQQGDGGEGLQHSSDGQEEDGLDRKRSSQESCAGGPHKCQR